MINSNYEYDLGPDVWTCECQTHYIFLVENTAVKSYKNTYCSKWAEFPHVSTCASDSACSCRPRRPVTAATLSRSFTIASATFRIESRTCSNYVQAQRIPGLVLKGQTPILPGQSSARVRYVRLELRPTCIESLYCSKMSGG